MNIEEKTVKVVWTIAVDVSGHITTEPVAIFVCLFFVCFDLFFLSNYREITHSNCLQKFDWSLLQFSFFSVVQIYENILFI